MISRHDLKVLAVEIGSSWWTQFFFYNAPADKAIAENVCHHCFTVTEHLRQRSAPPGLSPAPTSQTLLVGKWKSLLPYKTADILLGFIKKRDYKMDEHKWHHFVFVCMCASNLSWTWLWHSSSFWQSQSSGHGAAQTCEEPRRGDRKELVSPLAAHLTCFSLSCSQMSGLFTTGLQHTRIYSEHVFRSEGFTSRCQNFISCHFKCFYIVRINYLVGENIQKH